MDMRKLSNKEIFLMLFGTTAATVIGGNIFWVSMIGEVFTWGLGFGFNWELGLIVIGLVCVLIIAALVYSIIMWNKAVREVNRVCADDGKHSMLYIWAVLLGGITLGIFLYFYLYNLQSRIYEGAERNGGKVALTGKSVVIWMILGLFTLGASYIVAEAMVLFSYNNLADSYNKKPSAIPEPKKKGNIQCIAGSLVGGEVDLADGESVFIGASERSSIIVVDSKVSGKHCEVSYNANKDKYYVTDYSTNGTRLTDGTRLPKNVQVSLERGSVLILSHTTKFLLK